MDPSESDLRSLKSWARDAFLEQNRPFSPRDIDWMIEHVTGYSRLELISRSDERVAQPYVVQFKSLVQRRLKGEPLQHILEYTEFYGRRIAVSPAALIPRPETEGLVELALVFLGGRSNAVILDVGTGSGCIAISLAAENRDHTIYGVDVSEPALELARHNGGLNDVSVTWSLGDMYNPNSLPDDVERFDLIISNPPYIPEVDIGNLQPEVRDYDPILALTPGPDHFKPYKALARFASERLVSGGALMVEIEERFGAAVEAIFIDFGFSDVVIHKDLAGRNRYVTGREI
jgi:release factor glutamine methyltransferase